MKTVFFAVLALGMATMALAQTEDSTSRQRFNSGVGAGVMYGELGANLEYRMTEQAALTTGIGLNGEDQWFGGARYYFKPEGKGVRGRITAGVARTGHGNRLFGSSDDLTTRGVVGIGWSWANANNDYRGFSFDLTTTGSVSLGYQF